MGRGDGQWPGGLKMEAEDGTQPNKHEEAEFRDTQCPGHWVIAA